MLHMDAGTRRLLEWHAEALEYSLRGLVGRVCKVAHSIRLSVLQQLHAAQREPGEIAYEVLAEGRAF